MDRALAPSHAPDKYAYCEWVSCEAYLGHQTLKDTDCRSPGDLARLAAELYRQHLLRGRRSGREVYTRVIPQNIRLRVTTQIDDGSREDILDQEFDTVNIARCSTGHDPFPHVVVFVHCIGVIASQRDDVERRRDGGTSTSEPHLEMRCHGIACANPWIASRLARTISSAFEDSRTLPMQPQAVFLPQGMQHSRKISRNTVSTIAAPPAYQSTAQTFDPSRGSSPRDPLGAAGHHQTRRKDEKKGLPEVGAW
nr:uncharacterized protein LOC129279252 [Lytechinus pictus]